MPADRRHWPAVACLAGVALLLARDAVALDAIDMSLEELTEVRIVSTPKFAESPDRIPSAVSVLTYDDIRTYGWLTLGEALRSLQGFNITDDHTYAYPGIRGVAQPGDYRPRMQILVDGISVNDNLYASVPVDSAFPLDMGLVERIEVIRGPSASVYGGDAMFGVINVVTRGGSGSAGVSGSEVAATAGSGRDHRLRATWSGQAGSVDALLSASGFRAHGRSLRVDDLGDDIARLHRLGGEEGEQVFLRARGADWRVSMIHAERDRRIPTGSYGTIPNDGGHVESDGYDLFGLAKDWRLGAMTVLQQQFFSGRYRYDGTFPYDYSPDDPRLINVDKGRGNWWGLENRLVHAGFDGHRLIAGFEYRVESRQDQRNFDKGYGCFDAPGAPTCLDDRRDGRQLTFLAQDEIAVGTGKTLTLGLRHDRLGGRGSFTSPRLGYIHDAGAPGLFKVLYGSAFRVPTVYERAYVTPTFVYGNPALKAEKMKSIEVSWEKQFDPGQRLTASAYRFEVERMISTDSDTGLAYNSGKVRAAGLEMEYERRWRGGVHLRAGVSLQHADGDFGRLDNSPRRMAKFNFALPVGLPDLKAGFEGQWIDRRGAAFGKASVPSHALANLHLSYRPAGRPWDVALGIHNLFDRRYADPVSPDTTIAGERWRMWQLGRTMTLSGALRF